MLIKKCLRDIKLNKSQFLNIFIMVFLGVFVFAGIHSYMDGMRKVEKLIMKIITYKIYGLQEKTFQMMI